MERTGDGWGSSLAFAQRCNQAFDALEKHADFRHVAAQDAVHETELLRRRQSIIDELADIVPIGRLRIPIAKAAGNGSQLAAKWLRSFGLARPLPNPAAGVDSK